ncbi:hypothetical protein EDD15DRAFT_2191036 [Pisolithus albus]|nr:hypothetical protein EDD15DRAFT_2191036 [Pisolithus albus]
MKPPPFFFLLLCLQYLQVMECSPVLLLKPQKFLVLLLLSLMQQELEAGRSELGEGFQNTAYAFPPCLAAWLQGSVLEGNHGVEAEEAYGACDGDVELHGHIPKVHEEDLVEVVLGLVGNGVEEESLEHVGYAQIGEQHHMLAEGMWEGKHNSHEGWGGMGLGAVGQRWESREIQGKDPIQVLGYRGIQGKSKGKGYRGERSKIQVQGKGATSGDQ